MKILLVGSGGFLGNHVKTILNNEYDTFEITGKKQIDITKYDKLDKYLSKLKPDIVINCAAFVGGISYGYNIQLGCCMKIQLWQLIFIELHKKTKLKS